MEYFERRDAKERRGFEIRLELMEYNMSVFANRLSKVEDTLTWSLRCAFGILASSIATLVTLIIKLH